MAAGHVIRLADLMCGGLDEPKPVWKRWRLSNRVRSLQADVRLFAMPARVSESNIR